MPRTLFELNTDLVNRVPTSLQVLDLSPERESCLSCNMVSIPTAIGQLTNLRVLMLDTNELADLPVELSELSNLERLSLSNNHLSSLPPGFERLQKMRSLHAANNAFDKFPESLCQFPELEFLDLSDNKLAALPESISNLSNLQVCIWVRLENEGGGHVWLIGINMYCAHLDPILTYPHGDVVFVSFCMRLFLCGGRPNVQS